MNNKIVKYEIQLAVPSNLVSQHLKKFTNLLQTTINKAQPMKNTEFISVKIIKWKLWQKLEMNGKNGKEAKWFSQMVLGDNWWRMDGADWKEMMKWLKVKPTARQMDWWKLLKKQKIIKNGGAKSLNRLTVKQRKGMCSPTDGTSCL